MEDMTQKEYRAFMMDTVRTGKIATVRADGRPHITPIWFVLEGDALYFTTWHASVKAKNLLTDNRISLCVDDEKPPFSYVIIEGIAHVNQTPDLDNLREWATKIAGRYMGEDQAKAFGERNGVVGEWLIRIEPTKVLAKKGIAD